MLALFGVAIVELAVQPAATAPTSTTLATAALLAEAIGVRFERLTVLAFFALVTFFAFILEGCVGLDLLRREILEGFFSLILGSLLPVLLALVVRTGFGAVVETATAARPAARRSPRSSDCSGGVAAATGTEATGSTTSETTSGSSSASSSSASRSSRRSVSAKIRSVLMIGEISSPA